MDKMTCTPILSIDLAVKKVKDATHKNGDIDGTCKQSLTFRPPYVRAVFSLRGMELSEGLRDITLPGR